jgi:hypothetical protein
MTIQNLIARARRVALRARTALAVTAVTATAAIGLGAALTPSTAQAQYWGGCTYSWGAPCYIVYGNINFLGTLDSQRAYNLFGGTKVHANNGYPAPKADGRERDVCASLFYQEGGPQATGWVCDWQQVWTSFPYTVGYSAIGTNQVYYGIAIYQLINWTEGGPCGQMGSEC